MARVKFRQRDLVAAVKALRAAGYGIARIEFGPDGRPIVIPAELGDDTVQTPINEWDDTWELADNLTKITSHIRSKPGSKASICASPLTSPPIRAARIVSVGFTHRFPVST